MKKQRKYGADRQHTDDKLDKFLTEKMDQICDLTKTDKRIADELETCSKWLSVFVRTTKEEKYARNCLVSLMYKQLKENGRLSEPFTDLENCNRDLNQVHRRFRQKMEKKLITSDVTSPPELQVPQPSSANPFSQVQLQKSDGAQVINITDKEQIVWQPITEEQIKKLDKMEAVYDLKTWQDKLTKHTPSRAHSSNYTPTAVPSVSYPIRTKDARQHRPKTKYHESKSIKRGEVIELFTQKNFKDESDDEDEAVHKKVVEKPDIVKKGPDLKAPSRANRDYLERERNRAQIERRRVKELKERKQRELERARMKSIEESKRKIAETRENRERIFEEKERLEKRMQVYERRIQESKLKQTKRPENLLSKRAEIDLVPKEVQRKVNVTEEHKDNAELYVRKKIEMATSLAKQQSQNETKSSSQEEVKQMYLDDVHLKKTEQKCDATNKLVISKEKTLIRQQPETDQKDKGEANTKKLHQQKTDEVANKNNSVEEDKFHRGTETKKEHKEVKDLQETDHNDQSTSQQEINRIRRNRIKLVWDELQAKKREERRKIKELQTLHDELKNSDKDNKNSEPSPLYVEVRDKLKELLAAKKKSEKQKCYANDHHNQEKYYENEKHPIRENQNKEVKFSKGTTEISKAEKHIELRNEKEDTDNRDSQINKKFKTNMTEVETSEERGQPINYSIDTTGKEERRDGQPEKDKSKDEKQALIWNVSTTKREDRRKTDHFQKEEQRRNEIKLLDRQNKREEPNKERQSKVKEQETIKLQQAGEQYQTAKQSPNKSQKSRNLRNDMPCTSERDVPEDQIQQVQENVKRVDRKILKYLQNIQQNIQGSEQNQLRQQIMTFFKEIEETKKTKNEMKVDEKLVDGNPTESHAKIIKEPVIPEKRKSSDMSKKDSQDSKDNQDKLKKVESKAEHIEQLTHQAKDEANTEVQNQENFGNKEEGKEIKQVENENSKEDIQQNLKSRTIWTQYENVETEGHIPKMMETEGDIEKRLKAQVREEKIHKEAEVDEINEKIKRILLRREELKEERKNRQPPSSNMMNQLNTLIHTHEMPLVNQARKESQRDLQTMAPENQISSENDAYLSMLVIKAERERHSRECFFVHIEKQHKRLSEAELKFQTLEMQQKQLATEITECNETLTWLKTARHRSETNKFRIEPENDEEYQQMKVCVSRLSPEPEFINFAWCVGMVEKTNPTAAIDSNGEGERATERQAQATVEAEPQPESVCDSGDFETSVVSRMSSKRGTDYSTYTIDNSKPTYDITSRTHSISDHIAKRPQNVMHDPQLERDRKAANDAELRRQLLQQLKDISKSGSRSSTDFSKTVPTPKTRQRFIRFLEPGSDEIHSSSNHGNAVQSNDSDEEPLEPFKSCQIAQGEKHTSNSDQTKKTSGKVMCSRYVQTSQMHLFSHRRQRKFEKLLLQQDEEDNLFKELLRRTKMIFESQANRTYLRSNNDLLFRKLGEAHLQQDNPPENLEPVPLLENLQLNMLSRANKILRALQDFEDWVTYNRLRKGHNRKIDVIESLLCLPCRIFDTLFEPLMNQVSGSEVEEMREQISELDRKLDDHITKRLYALMENNSYYCLKKQNSV